MTYNQIIKVFETLSSSSLYIKSFSHGEEWEINEDGKPGHMYPLLWIVPTQVLINEQTKNYTFKVLCMDRVNKDESNEKDVLSDTLFGLEDFIKEMRRTEDDYQLTNNPTLSPFKEDFGDWCAGWAGDFEIETNFNSNNCDTTFE